MSKFRLTPKCHSKTGTIIYQVKKINEIIDAGNFKLALKMIKDLLPTYPEDYGLLRTLVRVYTTNAMYDEALEILNTLNEDCVFLKKIEIYLIKDNMSEVKRLYDKYFDVIYSHKFSNDQMQLMYFIISGYLGTELDDGEFDRIGYGLKQSYAYSKDRAIEHIRERHFIFNEESEHEQALFNDHIVLEEIFENISNYVKNNTEKLRLISNSMHLCVKYNNAGIPEQGKKDYIEVICKIGTGDILTMYPCTERGNETIDYKDILEFNGLKNQEHHKKLILNAKKH